MDSKIPKNAIKKTRLNSLQKFNEKILFKNLFKTIRFKKSIRKIGSKTQSKNSIQKIRYKKFLQKFNQKFASKIYTKIRLKKFYFRIR